MSKGILVVQSQPASAEDSAAYNEWYEQTHIPEMLAIDGFVHARRYESADGQSCLAIYEIDGDIHAAKAKLADAQPTMSRPEGVQLSPPPTVQYFRFSGDFGR